LKKSSEKIRNRTLKCLSLIKKERDMKIVSLYPSNDVYQVVSENESTIYFQGSKDECKKRLKKLNKKIV